MPGRRLRALREFEEGFGLGMDEGSPGYGDGAPCYCACWPMLAGWKPASPGLDKLTIRAVRGVGMSADRVERMVDGGHGPIAAGLRYDVIM